MGPVVRFIGSGIGLASEAFAHRKQKKAAVANASATREAGETNSAIAQDAPGSGTIQCPDLEHDVVEVSDEHGEELVSMGQAVQVGYNHKRDASDDPPSYDEVVRDEEDWELDETAGEENLDGDPALCQSQSSTGEKPGLRKILSQFLARHPSIGTLNKNSKSLLNPVIIPQRRPQTRSRGFVKAYAPILQDCGIDQETWMDFLETFHKASQASSVFSGILIAGNMVGFVPSISAMVASILVQTTATAAIALQSRSRTNTFLDDINEHFFRPRGLFVLLIKYKGSRSRWSSEPLDISHAVTTSGQSANAPNSGNTAAKLKQNLKYASGTLHGAMEIPECAPLIYPAIDKAAAKEASPGTSDEDNNSNPDEKSKRPSAFKRSSNFVNDYLDRRAHAAFQSANPSSTPLHAPNAGNASQFASRYSDPNHPASSGDLAALLTGGKVDLKEMRRRKDQRKTAARGFTGPLGYVREYRPVRRMMQQEVLYLMVVNMPSEEEMERARGEEGERVDEGEA